LSSVSTRILAAATVLGVLLVSTGLYVAYHADEEGFGIYLEGSDDPLISDADILSYNETSHEIVLEATGAAAIAALEVPVHGLAFSVEVGGRSVYSGSFWSPISSVSYAGVVIETLGEGASIRLQLGYPESTLQGEDPRSDPNVLDHFARSAKLVQ
jgi:hypothetical protein